MTLSQQIAKHLRDVHFGGNWTTTNLRDTLKDVTWKQAVTQIQSFNTIATLTYHVNYFVTSVLKVLQGGPLESKDMYSFDHPPIESQEDWEQMLARVWDEAEQFATLIEQLPDSKLNEDFVDSKYGTYFRNLEGIIEHMHYHLGQIVIIKKLIAEESQ
jgi:uncharacterized damage-inducible protein DinB